MVVSIIEGWTMEDLAKDTSLEIKLKKDVYHNSLKLLIYIFHMKTLKIRKSVVLSNTQQHSHAITCIRWCLDVCMSADS